MSNDNQSPTKTVRMKTGILFIAVLALFMVEVNMVFAQRTPSNEAYKKRVLESTELSFLSSYYGQDGNNAAVTGGRGTEELNDFTSTFVVSIPLNDDDVLTIDAGVSAYTSASSSNIDPFDSSNPADAFVESTGASRSDLWANMTGTYTHNSDDRNAIWSAKMSVASEYDYFSLGFGGSYTRLFNDKNTEVSINGNVYLDNWKVIYPIEFRNPGRFEEGFDLNDYEFIGNTNFKETFRELEDSNRNSYSLGLNFSQILSKKLQASVVLDVVQQEGLLSTPFQRVYFNDVEGTFIENFQLGNDIERLPDSRRKIALGGRLNYYLNEFLVLRSFYRYYYDDWGIHSHTASIELPIKIGDKITLYPMYRYYVQTSADYFAVFEGHLSTDTFYTSDFDLSDYTANQFGFGITYTDIFAKFRIWKWGLKSVDLKFNQYDRNNSLSAYIITSGFNFVMD